MTTDQQDILAAANDIAVFRDMTGFAVWRNRILAEMNGAKEDGLRCNPFTTDLRQYVAAAATYQAFERAISEFDKIMREAQEVVNDGVRNA